ncbi:MAG TPA: ABC transporter permease subunit, partial [Myxococcota bacterium]|nr:ABC transporter permease subunit [Myxococcota bacterium]
MKFVFTMWKKELRSYFVSPIAYVFLAAYLLIAGLFFYLGVTLTGEASLRVLAGNLAITQIFVLPMLTMRHFAEERRQGTLEMLLTAPIPLWAIVVGKWAASVTLCVIMFAGTLVFPAVLAYYGDPDWGVMLTSYLGLFAVACAFCAAGLFSSSLLDDQMAAGLIGSVILVPFWLVGR